MLKLNTPLFLKGVFNFISNENYQKEYIMKNNGLLFVLLSSVTFMSVQANATLITFDGQLASDGSGLTSQLIDSSNQLDLSSGFFIETFDASTQMTGFPFPPNQDTSYNYNNAATNNGGCGINTLGAPGIVISETGGGLGVMKGSVSNVAAQPGGTDTTIGDTTCYGFTPKTGSSGTITVDYFNFLPQGVTLDYFGFYWGSVDTYNDFEFFLDNQSIFQITGSTLLSELLGSSGNQNSTMSNTYVNIFFENGESFNKFTVTSNGIAGEFDNVVVRSKIPEPMSLTIFALGLIGLAYRTKKHQL
ncbi:MULTISPECIES: Npun_F0296 family exosortase-dependent surface protein [Colwellia]|nr:MULTISPECIES: PEP-CTERM sorting domain-containing protein [Colwellia]